MAATQELERQVADEQKKFDEARVGDDPETEASAEDEKPPKPMQIPLPGSFERISDKAGGSAPTTSTARLLGGSLPIEGQYAGEEVVTLLVEAKVGAVEVVYTTDDWGNTTRVERRHKMRMVSVRRFGE